MTKLEDKSRINPFRYFRDVMRKIAAIGVLAAVSAQLQAGALVVLMLLLRALQDGKHGYHGHPAGVSVRISNMQLTLLAGVAIVLAALSDTALSWIKSKMVMDWDYEHREQVVGEYLHADYPTQASERLGTLSLITSYVQRGAGMLGAIMSGLVAALSLITYVGFAFLIDYRAAILMVATVAVISALLRPLMRRVKVYGRALSSEMIEYTRDVTEATRMVRDLRVFDAFDPLADRLNARSRRLNLIRQRGNFVNGMVGSTYTYLGMLIIVAGLAAAQSAGRVDVVKLGFIALLLMRSMRYGQGLQGMYQNIVDGRPYLEKLEDLRDLYRNHATAEGHLVLETVHTLELDEVHYTYDGKVDAVAGVSATFHVGEIIGIVGPSGGGKSTLSQLLLRLRVPTGGAIRIDGVDIADFKLSSWYQHVSVVPQDPRLFHATVAQNIALLDKRIPRERIVDAAKAAGVHDVIEALEDGYETRVGPAFRDLSGGQIQRIGIARALARGAQILVLDEPTSALDVHSEAIIQATLESLRGHALVVIIAHRLSTLSICDRIMVLRDGALETIGTLAETSERSEFFRRALEAGTLDIRLGDEREVTPTPDEV